MKTENAAITATLNQERERIRAYESKIMRHETSLDQLNRKLRDFEEYNSNMERKLGEKQLQLHKKDQEKEKQLRKFNSKIAEENDRKRRELESKLNEQKRKMEDQMRSGEEKLRLVTEIVNGNDVQAQPVSNLIHRFNSNCENLQPSTERKARSKVSSTQASQPSIQLNLHSFQGIAVANPRHRRSKSVGSEKWLEHRPAHPVPLGTILQPYYNAKSVKSPEMKDFANRRSSRYCLITQGADTDGEVETRLYKGDVIPTTSGGAQVIFDDVECLKQLSPGASPPRKRKSVNAEERRTPAKKHSSSQPQAVESRCSVGIEGHSKKQRL